MAAPESLTSLVVVLGADEQVTSKTWWADLSRTIVRWDAGRSPQVLMLYHRVARSEAKQNSASTQDPVAVFELQDEGKMRGLCVRSASDVACFDD